MPDQVEALESHYVLAPKPPRGKVHAGALLFRKNR